MNEIEETGLVEVGQDYGKMLKEPDTESYCSINPTDMDSKRLLYKVMTKPDFKLNDCFNKEIQMVDLFCETVNITGDDGVTRQCPRIVIVDADGKAYQSVSFGVFNSLRRIIDIFGEPHWDEPLTIMPVQISKGKNKMTSLEII